MLHTSKPYVLLHWRQNKSPALYFTYLFSVFVFIRFDEIVCKWNAGICCRFVCMYNWYCCFFRSCLADDLCDLFTHVCILYLRRQCEQQLFILPWQRAFEQSTALLLCLVFFFFRFLLLSPKRAYGCCLPRFNTCTVHSVPNNSFCESTHIRFV